MTRIQLMRATPVVWRGDSKAEITGRLRSVFRLLILRKGSTVDTNDIASLHAGDAPRTSATARGKIKTLRTQLGEANFDLIKSVRASGYSANLEGWAVDALHFEQTMKSLEGSFEKLLLTPISPAQASDEVLTLTDLLNQWEANPAVDLYENGYEQGQALAQKFEGFKRKADHRLIMLQLYSGNYELRIAARSALNSMVRKGEASPVVWKLLMLAQHALGEPRATTFKEIEEHFNGKHKKDESVLDRIPPELRELHRNLNMPAFSGNPFLASKPSENAVGPTNTDTRPTSAKPIKDVSENETLIRLCNSLGISSYSSLRHPDSELAPLSCIRKTRAHLDFAGLLASKWVADARTRAELDELLHRLDRENGEVRFQIINPNSSAFKRLSILREFDLSKESLVHLRALIDRHKSFSVKVIDALPSFRIVAIDDSVMSFSPYRLAADAYEKGGRGLDTPYVVLNPSAEYPLAEAFRLLFEENWNNKNAQLLQDLPF